MHPLSRDLSEWLRQRDNEGLLRRRRTVESRDATILKVAGQTCVDFCSNDYLGFADDPITRKGAEEALRAWGSGAAASRLVSGDLAVLRTLEQALADWKQTEAALVFPSGYMANVGVITALLGQEDTVVLDRLAHASLIDGARLSGARLRVFPHNDVARLDTVLRKPRKGRTLVVTESVFSMDGDRAPLVELAECCKEHNAQLLVDEAHALGVYGDGRGCVAEAGVAGAVDVVIGTLSKALGSQGGFVAGSGELIEFLVNNARSFIYSTGLAPAAAGAALAALREISEDRSRIDKLWRNVSRLRTLLAGLAVQGEGPICPVVTGTSDSALGLSRKLFDAGFLVPAIRPPTVPVGTSRVRITVSAAHTLEQINDLAAALKNAFP